MLIAVQPACHAQVNLSLNEAIQRALSSRASLKAEGERILEARGLKRQAALRPNPEFLFQNENLRPGQTYSRDVDTVAYVTQPLDVYGKRGERVSVAQQGVERSEADYSRARAQIVDRVRQAYWTARGAQENRRILEATVANFQKVVDFHAAQLSVGAISEQDFLRVRLESERLKISASLASIEANRAAASLFKEMGRPGTAGLVLTEPIGAETAFSPATLEQTLAQRIELKVARAALAEAQAKLRLANISVRPDLSVFAGYKRTQLPDTLSGVNTLIAGFQVTLPVSNKNQGNRDTAEAEVRRLEQTLAAVEADVRAEYEGAFEEYRQRRDESVAALEPLRQSAATVSQIAAAAYAEGGTELLRLLDADRARIEADLAWARGMTEYHQSIARLETATGVDAQ